MSRIAFAVMLLCTSCAWMQAQELDKVQIHGFATQGFLYSQDNNYLVADANHGTAAWTEAALSVTDAPSDKLRIGMQMHFYQLGNHGLDGLTVDWALGDYQVNRFFGVRAGKVKTPLGLFNDSQDVDAVYLWTLLPQSTYPIDNRSFFLSHLGGEIYGSFQLAPNAGRLSYRAYGGENSLDTESGYVKQITQVSGLVFSRKPGGHVYGTDLRWHTPFKPLLIGSSLVHEHIRGTADNGWTDIKVTLPVFYAQYDSGKFYAAGEYRREPIHSAFQVGPVEFSDRIDARAWYAMAAYRMTDKLQVGTYYSHLVFANQHTSYAASNSKDFVLSARYDMNSNIYAKAETHFLHGEAFGYYQADNPQGLRPRSQIVTAKLGFTF